MICTTLNRIRANSPCENGWRKLLAGLGKTEADDEPLPYARIVEINGLEDALWACRAEPQYKKEWRLFAVWCARQSLKYTGDWRAVAAVCIAERYAHGMATDNQMRAAWHAADAWSAARAAVYAVWDAAADAAARAADAAARGAAQDAARAAQRQAFLDIVDRAALRETHDE